VARTSSQPTGAWPSRLARIGRALPPERRLAAYAAIGLFLTLFLPWYQDTVVAKTLRTGTASVTGWGAFSWVEAAVLLVAAGVLTLLYQRADGRAIPHPFRGERT
jgi:ABC-type multidrug transport system fused ATPase/permease subunit